MVGILDLLFPPDDLSRGKAGSPTGTAGELLLAKAMSGGGSPFMPANPPVPSSRPEMAGPAPQEAPSVDPMRTASTRSSAADPYLAWQRGMGSSEGPDRAGGSGGGSSPGGGAGMNWRELLGAIGPALMMADPLGRNQGMAMAMMRQNDQSRQDAKTAQNQNATKKWLLTRGMDEATASILVSDPVMLRQWFGERGKKPDPKDALELEKMQLEINKMRNPQTFRTLTDEEEASLGLDTSKSYQRGPDGKVDQIGGSGQTINLGDTSDKQIFEAMSDSATSARSAANGLTSLREARTALDGGIISGTGADYNLGLQKIGAALGVTDPKAIINTETFRSAIAPQVAAVMNATVGSSQISNADREFAQQAAGGSINLDSQSIRRLLDIMERAGNAAIQSHRDRLDKVYPDGHGFDRERALFDVSQPARPETPPAANAGRRLRATNGSTILEFDGTNWVPVQ